MIKLSFIVPIYNVEQYLRKCVESLIKQDFSDYEIILVDDGSTDESSKICDEFVSIDNRWIDDRYTIRVIHQANGGLSAARNRGIMEAKGEFVCFVDSDDYWEENVLGELVRTMEEKQLDVLRYNYQNVRLKSEGISELENVGEYEIFQPFKTGKPYFDYSDDILDGETFLNKRLGYACYAWSFVLRRSILEGCLFTPGIHFEDTDWTPRMLLKAKRVSSTNHIVYNYLWREGSITLPTDSIKKKKNFDDRLKILRGFLKQQELVKDRSWFEWNIASVTVSLLSTIATFPVAERITYLKELQSLNIFPLTTYRAVGNNNWRIRLANISPALYCKIVKILHR